MTDKDRVSAYVTGRAMPTTMNLQKLAEALDTTPEALLADRHEAMDRKLKTLVAKLAEVCWDGGTLDGAELQMLLVEADVLIGVQADAPCGENCRCLEYDVEPPWTCYRLSEAFK